MIKCTCCNCGRPRFDSNHPPLQFQGIWLSLLGSMSTSYIHGAHTSDKTHIKIKKNAPRRQDATFPLYRIQPNYFVMGSYFKQSIIHSNLKRVWTIYHCRKYNKSKLFHGGGLKKRPGTECMGSGWIPLTMLPQRAFYFSQYSTIMTLSWDGLEMSYSTVCWMSCHCQGLENFDHRVRFPCRHKGIEEHDAKMNHSSQSPGREKCCMPSSLASHGIQTPLYYMARYAPKLPL